MLTQPGQHPPFQRGGMGDHGTGLAAAGAIAAALFQRERSGHGQLVTTSLLRQGVYTLSFDLATSLRFGVALAVGNRKTMGNPCINVYADQDGRWFWIVGLEGERHWPPLARAVGHPEWLADPRFATPSDRAKNAAALIAALDADLRDGAASRVERDLRRRARGLLVVAGAEPRRGDRRPAGARGGRLRRGAGRRRRRHCSRTPADFHGTPWRSRAGWRRPSASTATRCCASSARTKPSARRSSRREWWSDGTRTRERHRARLRHLRLVRGPARCC